MATSRAIRVSASTCCPGRTTTGAWCAPAGPRRCSRARMGATMTLGGAGRSGSSPWRKPHRTANRRPMVSTSGLTRSKGRVSQAGRTATGPFEPADRLGRVVPRGPIQHAGQILGEPLCLNAGGADHQDGRSVAEVLEGGDDHRVGGVSRGQRRAGGSDENRDDGVSPQQGRDGPQRTRGNAHGAGGRIITGVGGGRPAYIPLLGSLYGCRVASGSRQGVTPLHGALEPVTDDALNCIGRRLHRFGDQ